MNLLRGATELDVRGQKRYAVFNTFQFALFCELRGLSLTEAQNLFSDIPKVPPLAWIDLYFSAFKAGSVAAKERVDFDTYDVMQWIEEQPELSDKLLEAFGGANGPNEQNRAQRRAAEQA